MRMDRQFACCTYECGTTKERFLKYSRECLPPALREGDIVVKEVENLLCSVGSIPLYLPPYTWSQSNRKKCDPKWRPFSINCVSVSPASCCCPPGSGGRFLLRPWWLVQMRWTLTIFLQITLMRIPKVKWCLSIFCVFFFLAINLAFVILSLISIVVVDIHCAK